MNCPNCKHEHTSVTQSRDVGSEVFRRRRCDKCGHNFVTDEQISDRPFPYPPRKKQCPSSTSTA